MKDDEPEPEPRVIRRASAPPKVWGKRVSKTAALKVVATFVTCFAAVAGIPKGAYVIAHQRSDTTPAAAVQAVSAETLATTAYPTPALANISLDVIPAKHSSTTRAWLHYDDEETSSESATRTSEERYN